MTNRNTIIRGEQPKPETDSESRQAAQPAGNANQKNPYGSPPGSGISMPAYYRPTPSIKNRNTFFPQSE